MVKMSETIGKIPLKKKIGISLSYLMQALILIYAIYSFCTLDYLYGIWSLFAFFLTLTPLILKRRFDITLPWELSLLIVLALYLHVGGSIRGWYLLLYPFYDKFAHLISSVLVAILGLISAVIMDQYVESIKMNRFFVAFFVIIFTMAMGVTWEIGEFLSDQILLTQAQHGLNDTMLDLIFDLIGGGVVSILGMIYLKYTPKGRFIKEMGIDDRLNLIKR
jgi:hypothetical protein